VPPLFLIDGLVVGWLDQAIQYQDRPVVFAKLSRAALRHGEIRVLSSKPSTAD
jgi:hypothetical protein